MPRAFAMEKARVNIADDFSNTFPRFRHRHDHVVNSQHRGCSVFSLVPVAPQSAGPQMETSHDAPGYSPGPELGGRRRQAEGTAADTGGLPGYIDSLESAHREHQAAVARIRQELLR